VWSVAALNPAIFTLKSPVSVLAAEQKALLGYLMKRNHRFNVVARCSQPPQTLTPIA
jgi:hypothetical protein